jgi:DNA-binding NtrC family response regulator
MNQKPTFDNNNYIENSSFTILCVDDSSSILDLLKIFLEKDYRVQVKTCKSADLALQVLDRDDINLIISDYIMPGVNGIELYNQVHLKKQQTPFIFYTSSPVEEINKKMDGNVSTLYYVQKWGPIYPHIEKINKIIKNLISSLHPDVHIDTSNRESTSV